MACFEPHIRMNVRTYQILHAATIRREHEKGWNRPRRQVGPTRRRRRSRVFRLCPRAPYLTTDERACAGEGASTGLKTSVPNRPCMNHVWPDFQNDVGVGHACGFGEARGVI